MRGWDISAHPIAQLEASDAPLTICLHRMLGGVGDILMSTVAARGLKEKFPQCHITYAVTSNYMNGSSGKILLNNQFIDKIIDENQLVKTDYDHYIRFNEIDFPQEAVRIPKERIDIYCDYVGVSPEIKRPVYNITLEEDRSAMSWIRGADIDHSKKVIYLNWASRGEKRSLSDVQLYLLLHQLSEGGYNVIVDFFKPVLPESIDNVVEHVGDVRSAAAIMGRCDYVITHDSLPLHIAGALNKKGVAIFTHTHPESRLTYFHGVKPVFLDLECLCWWKPCTKNTLECRNSITPEMIVTTSDSIVREDEDCDCPKERDDKEA